MLQLFPVGQPPITLHCDVSTDHIHAFVPEIFRREIFNSLHALLHPGIRASLKMVAEQYVWPAMRPDVALWARTCLQCLCSKVARHTRSEIGKFELPSSRFEHVHIDIVGPTASIRGFSFLPYLCGPVLQVARGISNSGDFSRGRDQGFLHWLDLQVRSSSQINDRPGDAVGGVSVSCSIAVIRHREKTRNSISSSRKRPSREISSAVESGYNGARKCLVDHSIAYHTNGILCHLDRGTTNHNWKPYLELLKGVQDLEAWKCSVGEPRWTAACLHPQRVGDFPEEVNMKEKVYLQPEEIPESEQEKSRESSSRQETTTRSGRSVRFNPKYT
ncbi:integrase_H2C2 domain-containing protein [Trichonephila clavipes]|nr:integrase_H2C2 domain-containing protein [Trichonephila clavipes]